MRILSVLRIQSSSNDVFAKCTLTLNFLGYKCLVLLCLVLFTSCIPEWQCLLKPQRVHATVAFLFHLLKYTLYLQWYKQENPKKQSNRNPAGMVNGETAVPSVWRRQRRLLASEELWVSGEATDAVSQSIRWAWVLLHSYRRWIINAAWKKRLWVIQGSFLMLLAFVLALTELWGFSSWKSRV